MSSTQAATFNFAVLSKRRSPGGAEKVGHQLDPAFCGRLVMEADFHAHPRAHLGFQLLRQARCDRTRRQPPRLRVADQATRTNPQIARTLEVNPLRKAFLVILPAAAPTIVTGMRISMGIAWLVIVAAEMLVGGTGIGYFVWNEWNNLSLVNVIFAVLVIGVVGMLLDLAFAQVQKAVTYVE